MENCKHKNAGRFHPSAPLYCEDCKNYLEYQKNDSESTYSLKVLKDGKS